MTREAAICIAKSSQLATGIAPWKVGLVLHHGLQSIVWNVDNTLKDDGMGTQSGDSLSIDAISGDVLQRLSWGGIP
jgi:hypothetical protein